jgi:hypothetical protein
MMRRLYFVFPSKAEAGGSSWTMSLFGIWMVEN